MLEQTNRLTKIHASVYWVWLWGPVITYCALIFFASAQRDLAPPEFPSSDKVAHFVEYGILGILWARAARATWPYWSFRMLLLSTMLFTGVYGWGDEWHQLYVPGRFSDRYDAIADVCGGIVGGVVYLVGSRWSLNRATRSKLPGWHEAGETINAK